MLPWLWQWHTVQQVMAMWFCVCVSVSLACWIMASSLRGVDGHLAELRNGRCRRWEEKGRTGRLTTYWWNEKSLAQPDNLPPSHLVMNGIQHWSSSSSHMALCTSVLHLSIYILQFPLDIHTRGDERTAFQLAVGVSLGKYKSKNIWRHELSFLFF